MQEVATVQEQSCEDTITAARAIVVGGLSYEIAEWLGDRGCSVTVAACGLSVVALPGPLYRAIIENGSHWREYVVKFFDEDGMPNGAASLTWDVDACETRVVVRA